MTFWQNRWMHKPVLKFKKCIVYVELNKTTKEPYFKNVTRVWIIYSEVICKDLGRSSNSQRIWGNAVSPSLGFWGQILSKRKKIVYSLTLFGVRYKWFVELECKQKLCGFPEDKNSNRRKVLIHEFHKNCLNWPAKRQIWYTNCDLWIASSNPGN